MHPEEASRKDAMKRAFSGSRAEIEENDMKAYLASSDSEADDEEQPEDLADGAPKLTKKEIARQRMREALGLGSNATAKPSKSEPVGEMEMTFTLNDEDGAGKKQVSANDKETTVEKYMRKEREKKAQRKEKALTKREGAEQPAEEEEEVEEAEVAQDGNELGFDDPFFMAEEPVKATKSSQRKEERLKKRELKEAEAKKNAAERAHLEKIMGKGSKNGGVGAGHFDMAEITRAEKQKIKQVKGKGKGKGKKKQETTEDDSAMHDDFNVDVGDDRFKAVFESHEYAIDPTNPKFTTTPGMKEIINKKRGHGDEGPSNRDKKARRR